MDPMFWSIQVHPVDRSESLAPSVEVGPTHLNHFLDPTRSPLVPSPLPQLLQKAGLYYDMFLRLGLSTVRRSHPVSGWLGGSWFLFYSNVEALLSYMATFPELVQKLEHAMPRYSVSANIRSLRRLGILGFATLLWLLEPYHIDSKNSMEGSSIFSVCLSLRSPTTKKIIKKIKKNKKIIIIE